MNESEREWLGSGQLTGLDEDMGHGVEQHQRFKYFVVLRDWEVSGQFTFEVPGVTTHALALRVTNTSQPFTQQLERAPASRDSLSPQCQAMHSKEGEVRRICWCSSSSSTPRPASRTTAASSRAGARAMACAAASRRTAPACCRAARRAAGRCASCIILIALLRPCPRSSRPVLAHSRWQPANRWAGGSACSRCSSSRSYSWCRRNRGRGHRDRGVGGSIVLVDADPCIAPPGHLTLLLHVAPLVLEVDLGSTQEGRRSLNR